MDHILTTCDAPGQEIIWTLARNIWRKKTKSELIITKGTIMSCGVQPATAHRSPTKRTTELFRRILLSESAHLIWRLRNERVINKRQPYSENEISQCWLGALNRRLRMDCLLRDKRKYNKKVILKSIVLGTWQNTLENEESLPEDWTKEIRVLVGMVK